MIPEESLRQAAQRAQEALLDSLPETPAVQSPRYWTLGALHLPE